MKKNLITVILFFIMNTLSAQSYDDFFCDKIQKTDSSKFSVKIDNNNFFKNNEYFNSFYEGYTLIGLWLKPQIQYQPTKKISFRLGVNALMYFGDKKFASLKPVVKITYKPHQNIKLIFGELDGAVNHRLTDQILLNENILNENSELGLQHIFQNKRFFSDTWLWWKQFIWYNSPFQEQLLFGTSNLFTAFENTRNKINLKFIAIASHDGGQIDNSDEQVKTIVNTVSGFEYSIFINKKFLEKIKFSSLYHTSTDVSPTKKSPYIQGFGILSFVELSNNFLDLKLEHWFSKYYFSRYGNLLFQSVSSLHDGYFEDRRAFINLHLFWQKEIVKIMNLGAGASLYYDLYNLKIDYSFGFYIKTNLNFDLSKKIKK